MTCTCTVEDAVFTLWDGSAFMSQCPASGDQIILLHSQFGLGHSECGRISAVPVSQELQNYTSNVTVTVNTLNNGSSMRCSAGGSAVGMTVLNVGGRFKIYVVNVHCQYDVLFISGVARGIELVGPQMHMCKVLTHTH